MFNIIHYTIDINCRDKTTNITYLLDGESRNQLRRCNVPPNHRPACSSISQQRCHPRAGHDSFRIRVNCRLAHSQGDTKQPNQHRWVSQAFNRQAKPAQSKVQPLHTSSQTIPSQLCEEVINNRGQPQTMEEHSSSPMDNPELVLALMWPKQLNHNTPDQGNNNNSPISK